MTSTAEVQMKPVSEREYFVISVAHTQRNDPYITLWAGNNSGYRGRIETAGRYTGTLIKSMLAYYNNGCDNVAVPCDVLEPLAHPVAPGFFDDDNGRWLRNNAATWKVVLANTVAPPLHNPEPEYRWHLAKEQAMNKGMSIEAALAELQKPLNGPNAKAWAFGPAVRTLMAALEQAQQYAKQRDDDNQDLMLTIGRLRVEREQLEASKLSVKLPDELVKAVHFYEQVKRENPPVETGAWKDATEWVLKEAIRAVVGSVEGSE